MFKRLALATAVTATALGGGALYAATTGNDCLDRVQRLESSYQRDNGAFGPGEMMSGLRNAEQYCKAGDQRMAEFALEALARNCRSEGGCA
jgi:hypothetical protein